MSTFADRIINFNTHLEYNQSLPKGFDVLNPYMDNPETMEVMRAFYHKFYNDSRHGAGVTGVPFTDTKRLESECGIAMKSAHTHEVSSVFMYDMIKAYGGVTKFYNDFYINSPFPLAIVRKASDGKWLNANYYDEDTLFKSVKDYMIATLKKHIALGVETQKVFVLGKKNATFLQKLNKEAVLFGEMVVLEHPRFIQQYKSKEKQLYIDKFLTSFGI